MHVLRFFSLHCESFSRSYKWRTHVLKASVSVVTVSLPYDISFHLIFSKPTPKQLLDPTSTDLLSICVQPFRTSSNWYHMVYHLSGSISLSNMPLIVTYVFLGFDSLFLFILEQCTIIKILSQFVMRLPMKDILVSSRFWQLSVKVL